MSKTLGLITQELNMSSTDEEIRNCLEKLVDNDFKIKLNIYMDEINDFDDLKDFIKEMLYRCYWRESDEYHSYDCSITEVYGVLVITVTYIHS